jgi:hypothetical protein
MRYAHNIAIAIVWLVVLIFSGCSRPSLKVGAKEPATFYLSGSNTVQFFQVANKAGRVWLLYPKNNGLSLNALSTIRYGEVPASCWQSIPDNATAPQALLEGEEYYAVAVIFDDDAVRKRFMVKNGKIVLLSPD